jgi:hypothetical protein
VQLHLLGSIVVRARHSLGECASCRGRSNEFVFANDDGAADVAVRNYFNRTTLLPPKDVFEALQQLKKEADAVRWRTPNDAT